MLFEILTPLQSAIFIFIIDFGIVMLLRIIFEEFSWGKWWTFKYGDTLFLPLYAFFASAILHTEQDTLVKNLPLWWHIGVLGVGYIALILREVFNHKSGSITLKQQLIPGQIYHSIVSGVVFYLVVSPLPILVEVQYPAWAFVGSIFALVGFGLTVFGDIFIVNNHSVLKKAK